MGKTVEKRQVCRCENCGNEAEMVFTCTLEDVEQSKKPQEAKDEKAGLHTHQVKGSATCSHCGSEADMWIDY